MKIILLFIALSTAIAASAGENGFEVLQATKNSYTQARNGNNTLSTEPSDGVFANPVSLHSLKGDFFVNSNFSLQFEDTKTFSITGGYKVDSSNVTGLGVFINDYGSFNETTIDAPYGTGSTFSAQEILIQPSYSYKINNMFTAGVSPFFLYEKYYKYNASLIGINIGVNADFNSYKVSLLASNIGKQISKFTETTPDENPPYEITGAFGNSEKTRFHWEIDIRKRTNEKPQFGFGSNYHINRQFNFYSGCTITADRISYMFDDIDESEYYFDESRLVSVGIEFIHKNFSFLFSATYVGSDFTPTTAFAISYK